MMLSGTMSRDLARLLLLFALIPPGCGGGGDTQPDAALPSEEVVGDNLCPDGIGDAYLLDNNKIAIACVLSSGLNSSVVLLDEDTHASTTIYNPAPDVFAARAVVRGILYIVPDGDSRRELQALRLDAGPVTPSTVAGPSAHGMIRVGISGTYAYWGWSQQQASGQPIYGLSRAPLAGGAAEDFATLPFSPSRLAFLDEDVYALGSSITGPGTNDYNISIAHISGSPSGLVGGEFARIAS